MSEVVAESPARTRRARQRADTRERLFEAAIAEFMQVGFASAQIPRIAKAAGVSRGTFYFHFPSKEHVLEELMERRERAIIERLAALRVDPPGFRVVLARLLDEIESESDEVDLGPLMRDVLAHYVRRDPGEPDSEGALGLLDELAYHIACAAERGEIRRDVEPERLAAMVLTSIFGLIVTHRASDPERRVGLELLIDLLLDGMGPKSS